MQLSQSGLEFIASFEGYHRALPNGDCTTYYCPAGVLTIGYGCTEGIREGEVWTKQQAQDRFRIELAKHEAAVTRLTTVELNQNQYDALVSFSYNCGAGALQTSTLLKKLNAGDYEGAARQFPSWNKGGGKVLPGLVRRRADEASLFRKPAAPSVEPDMAQKVDAPSTVPAGSRKVATARVGEATSAAGLLTLFGINIADTLGYGGQGLGLVKSYGIVSTVAALTMTLLISALIKKFAFQDHADGRAVSSGEAA
jgi:lysozyme